MVRLTLIARVRDGLPLAEGLDADKEHEMYSYKSQAKVGAGGQLRPCRWAGERWLFEVLWYVPVLSEPRPHRPPTPPLRCRASSRRWPPAAASRRRA